MIDGISFFVDHKNVPLELVVLFTKFVKNEINKKVIFRDNVKLEETMEQLEYDHVLSYWLRFISCIDDGIYIEKKED